MGLPISKFHDRSSATRSPWRLGRSLQVGRKGAVATLEVQPRADLGPRLESLSQRYICMASSYFHSDRISTGGAWRRLTRFRGI